MNGTLLCITFTIFLSLKRQMMWNSPTPDAFYFSSSLIPLCLMRFYQHALHFYLPMAVGVGTGVRLSSSARGFVAEGMASNIPGQRVVFKYFCFMLWWHILYKMQSLVTHDHLVAIWYIKFGELWLALHYSNNGILVETSLDWLIMIQMPKL